MKFNKKSFYIFFITLFFLTGFIFRLKAYSFSRPLWLDECYIFDNIYSKNFLEFFSVLSCTQSATPVFLILSKLAVHFFGVGEKALRLVPFLASIISLPVFYIFSKKFLKTPLSVIIANALFSINLYCIFYSQELKQYSTDILCFMLLFMILNKITTNNLNPKNSILYCTVTTTFPLLSLPSYFLIGAWFFREIFKLEKNLKKFIKVIILQIPILISFYLYYTNILQAQRDDILKVSRALWQQGFLSANPINDFYIIKNIILYYFNPCSFYITILILLLLGIFLLGKYYKEKENSFLLNTILIIITASFCQLYPLYERVTLFLIPVVIVFIAKCLDLVSKERKIISAFILITFILSFHNYNFNYLKNCYETDIWNYCSKLWYYHFEQDTYPNAKNTFEILKDNYNKKDIIIINFMSKAEYEYYQKYYNFSPKKEIFTTWIHTDSISDYIKELEGLTTKNNYYWLFYYTDYRNKNSTKSWQMFAKKNTILFRAPGLIYLKIK